MLFTQTDAKVCKKHVCFDKVKEGEKLENILEYLGLGNKYRLCYVRDTVSKARVTRKLMANIARVCPEP